MTMPKNLSVPYSKPLVSVLPPSESQQHNLLLCCHLVNHTSNTDLWTKTQRDNAVFKRRVCVYMCRNTLRGDIKSVSRYTNNGTRRYQIITHNIICMHQNVLINRSNVQIKWTCILIYCRLQEYNHNMAVLHKRVNSCKDLIKQNNTQQG